MRRRAVLVAVAATGVTCAGRGHGLGPEGDRTYRRIYRRTAAVVDNIVALTVPRMPLDALFNRQVWRAADGSVINTIKPPY